MSLHCSSFDGVVDVDMCIVYCDIATVVLFCSSFNSTQRRCIMQRHSVFYEVTLGCVMVNFIAQMRLDSLVSSKCVWVRSNAFGRKTSLGRNIDSDPQIRIDILVVHGMPCVYLQKQEEEAKGWSHTPLTRGFQARGQIDFTDMQSTPDGEIRFILSYRCHGTKFSLLEPLQSKEKKSVAWALFCIFTVLGPPATLQAYNGRECNGAACGGKAKHVDIDDEVRIACNALVHCTSFIVNPLTVTAVC
jgi:hypothetical protein